MVVKSLRHAIITAGSKGLGKMVTDTFLQNGFSVTVNYRSDKERVQQLKAEWAEYADRLHFVQGDITHKSAIEHIVDQAIDRYGRVDYLINNAGPYVFQEKKLVDYDDAQWYEMIEGNLSSVFHFIKRVIAHMRAKQLGLIIT